MKCRRSKGRLKHGGGGFQPNKGGGLGLYIHISKATLTDMGTHDKKDSYVHIFKATLTDMGTHDKRIGCMCTQSDII